MSQKTIANKGKKHLEQLFIGMDQGGTRFAGRPKDLLHLFLSGQIDLIEGVFGKDRPLEEKKALVISMANDVNKVLEEMDNERQDKEPHGKNSTDVLDYQI